ncbi:MAG: PaaI family thioesterase [Micromonosporaceae bacterium]
MGITVATGNEILQDNFAPWVKELGLVVEQVEERTAVLRLPWSDRLAREGGALSGQAIAAAADTATVIAISAARGSYGPMTTVQLSITYQRPVIDTDLLITARLDKIGRSLAFADVTMTPESASDPAARAATVYALLG